MAADEIAQPSRENAPSNENETGRTKDAGWEVGVRVTVAAPVEDVWDFLLGDGLGIWLGHTQTDLRFEKGAEYVTVDGVRGHIRSYTPEQRIRMSWQPTEWDHDSILQVSVKEAASGGTTIGFHQERLAGRDERKVMLGHWKTVTAELGTALGG
ncbi:MAG TPA: SRPBCC domain-containing protein [Galbitalea sp.]|jgi:uncharacterized protein YndB with AHSA1/START domain